MQKREITWIVLLVLLLCAYLGYFVHWGGKKDIQIITSIRNLPRNSRNLATYPIYFTLDDTYRLTSIKVTSYDPRHTNTVARVLWQLVSKNVSEPVHIFQYGQSIQGMEPFLKDKRPEPLIVGEAYVIEIAAGRLKGVSKPFAAPSISQ